MKVLSSNDFDRLAKAAALEYLDNSIPLEQTLAKISNELGLNPDQIHNLVQLANTLTHLTLFDKADKEKIIEFEPADPDKVLKNVVECPETPENELPQDSLLDKIMDMFGELPKEDVQEKVEKTGPGEVTKTVTKTGPGRKSMMIIRIRKVAQELESRKHAAAFEYKEQLDDFASEFAKLNGPDLEHFEKEAFALRGDAAIPVINDIRSCLKLPLITNISLEKKACVVDTASKEFQAFDQLLKLTDEYNLCKEACDYLQSNLGRWL